MKKQVLLIGALGGLGSATAKLLSRDGWHIYAADFQADVFAWYEHNPNITPVLMDITNADSIEKAFQLISSQTTGLDALINMAGILMVGSMVELPLKDLQKALDINLIGIYRVNKQFLQCSLKEKDE